MNWRFWKKICANNSMEDDKQVSLTPALLNRDSESDKKQYRSVLNLARKLEEKDILNIALTGPYGAGKSSILRSLKKDYPKYKYLSISLATLKSPLDDKKNEIDIDTMNNRIEYSILQQLIYKEKQETLYNSRLKRIYHKSTWAQYALSFVIIFYAVALIIVFEPSFLKVEWICNRLSNPVLNKWSDIFALSYIFIATIIFAQKTIKSLSNSKLNKLNLKNGEIELKENKEDTSVFNKHMDEIVYFFEVTNYNVVIIEDLDRFNNTDIFLKLREVNQLLNQSNSVGRKVTFIYAVKDDMFFDEERTKFFDYITTVIPIINSSNSADKLKEELEIKGFSDLNVEVIESLAFFIDDMRLLKNIVNEYAQYREKLDEKLDQNKLLAMIVYKNYYPKDFADLHKGKGVLYDCLHKKSELLIERNRQIDERIGVITKKLQSLEATHAMQEKELRLIYIEGYRKKLSKQYKSNVFSFFVENNFIPLEDIAENETLFNSLISQPSIRYQYFKGCQINTYYGHVRSCYDTSEDSCNVQFSQIEEIVNSDFTYHERLEALREGEKKYREQIKILELSRNNHYATPIHELLLDIDMQTHKIFSELKVSKMLEAFLKEGLINEDYFDYISFFFGKSINKHDHDFILELKLRHSLPYDYHIDKIELCVKNIPDKCYNDVSILNIQVVDCICQHLEEETNNSKLHSIAQVVKNNKKWDFLIDFYKSVEDSSPLFNHLGSIVDGLWKIFVKQNSDELFEAWLRFLELNYSTKESRNWLNKHFAFISHRVDLIGFDIVKQTVSNGKLIFTDIDAESGCLLEYVVENEAYMLTPENVVCAFVYYRNERMEALNNYPLNVTILRSCESAKPVSDYIDERFDDALNNVFITDAAKQESVEIILEIINSEDITEETKRKYLSGQHNRVSLSYVNNTQWESAIEVDIVTPAWPEIYAFYESQNNVMIASLRIFITKHIDELTDISELDDTQKELLANSALLTSDFEMSVYDKLIKIFDGVTFKDANINSVDNAHFKSLLCADMLPYSTYYTTTIRDNHSDVLTYYVDKYLDECIIEIEELPTDMRLYKYLMRNPRVIGEKALSVVQHFLPHIVWDNELANITLPVVKNNIEKFDYDTEKNILVDSTNLPERLSFLIDLIEKYRDDFDIVTELIESLGDSYRSITDKSKKATIENNHMNEMFLGKLKTIGYISSYREDDDKLRVSHKRNY
ncbi:P-loop NTPase fold protein [Parabacteroides sp. W1-Q-101]|uniref:YobI family P-loop NTPase n=1 Tax=Parabacteroides caeci TaxID=2949650 RepID=UPI00203085A4|nr:P-loop NTPase fold protein [Parabacteroides sp. W1-Q-101]MCM0718945.1 P-loop NTPase fold protein [Parabacteroides sp. W1-Q-101]